MLQEFEVKAGRIADAIAKYSEAIEADQDDNETLRATLLSNLSASSARIRFISVLQSGRAGKLPSREREREQRDVAKYSEAIEADQDDNETLRATLLSNRAAAHMKVSRGTVGDGGVVRFGLWAGGV
jgi:hypothetical protein